MANKARNILILKMILLAIEEEYLKKNYDTKNIIRLYTIYGRSYNITEEKVKNIIDKKLINILDE